MMKRRAQESPVTTDPKQQRIEDVPEDTKNKGEDVPPPIKSQPKLPSTIFKRWLLPSGGSVIATCVKEEVIVRIRTKAAFQLCHYELILNVNDVSKFAEKLPTIKTQLEVLSKLSSYGQNVWDDTKIDVNEYSDKVLRVRFDDPILNAAYIRWEKDLLSSDSDESVYLTYDDVCKLCNLKYFIVKHTQIAEKQLPIVSVMYDCIVEHLSRVIDECRIQEDVSKTVSWTDNVNKFFDKVYSDLLVYSEYNNVIALFLKHQLQTSLTPYHLFFTCINQREHVKARLTKCKN